MRGSRRSRARQKRRRRRPARGRKKKQWLPDEKLVVGEAVFTSPKGRTYRILQTTELDPYDRAKKERHPSDAG